MIKKVVRYIALTLLGFVVFLIVFVLISVGPVDRTPVGELPSYGATMDRIEALDVRIPDTASGFAVGLGKANITPSHPLATASYGKRRGRPYTVVHDSIFVRTMVVSNGVTKVAIVSADLLIMPPTVTRILPEKLARIGFSLDNTYLSATHSHNSIGHWGEGATRFIYGAYEDSVVQFIADGIVSSIERANRDLKPSSLKWGSVAVPEAVQNRLIDNGPEDPWLRVLEVQRSDSSKAVLVSYAAHATCLSSGTLELSRDYPGMVVDALEEGGYHFAMFLAGGVGSHKGTAPANDWVCMSWMSEKITDAFFSGRNGFRALRNANLVMTRVPLELGPSQVKIAADWKVRSWLFSKAFGEYDAFLTALRIGDVVMLGTPCDFSGEFNASLDSTAASLHMEAMVTSFNGGYIGYVTPAKYYDVDHYETRLMNWYAPGSGEYLRDCMRELMIAVSDTR